MPRRGEHPWPAILLLLIKKDRTVQEIAGLVGLSCNANTAPDTVRRTLERLKEEGLAEYEDYGKGRKRVWRWTPPEREK